MRTGSEEEEREGGRKGSISLQIVEMRSFQHSEKKGEREGSMERGQAITYLILLLGCERVLDEHKGVGREGGRIGNVDLSQGLKRGLLGAHIAGRNVGVGLSLVLEEGGRGGGREGGMRYWLSKSC